MAKVGAASGREKTFHQGACCPNHFLPQRTALTLSGLGLEVDFKPRAKPWETGVERRVSLPKEQAGRRF